MFWEPYKDWIESKINVKTNENSLNQTNDYDIRFGENLIKIWI